MRGKRAETKEPRSVFRLARRKRNQIRVLRGRVPRKTHCSACQCASVPRKRVRAAGCISPLSAKPHGFADSLTPRRSGVFIRHSPAFRSSRLRLHRQTQKLCPVLLFIFRIPYLLLSSVAVCFSLLRSGDFPKAGEPHAPRALRENE